MPAVSDSANRVVRFDDFELNRVTLELRKGGVSLKLQQQPARVLALLTERAGDLVSRETLRQEIWGEDTFVDFDRGVNYCIRQIRTVLGDTADAPRYIETLRGRGYRFVGALHDETPKRTSRTRSFAIAAAAAIAMLCVLAVWAARERPSPGIGIETFESPATEREWTEALRAQIVSRLTMRSRTPVVDLARTSHANPRLRLEGRVDRSAEQYRVTVLLRDTSNGSVQWSDVFAGPPGDWVDAQSEMADIMTRAIRFRVEGPSAGLPMRRSKLGPRSPMPPPS